ncbi:hypothetical protein ELI_2001 [Eubacterium callanderi]|uniref:Uncharacterized protein n=1 Tax=Eubacterium callanderi TaxID=53442 RepID=E3GDQ4_9FIRM|nr:hypothetical protein ELI_2001 [Eubacterium callanderi]
MFLLKAKAIKAADTRLFAWFIFLKRRCFKIAASFFDGILA